MNRYRISIGHFLSKKYRIGSAAKKWYRCITTSYSGILNVHYYGSSIGTVNVRYKEVVRHSGVFVLRGSTA